MELINTAVRGRLGIMGGGKKLVHGPIFRLRCQSCGMPLGEGFFGTTENKSASAEYCKFCYKDGEFLEPELRLEQMIERSVEQMQKELKFPLTKAKRLANEVIPSLKRWR